MKYIDLHTHQLKSKNVLEIKNIFAQDFETAPGFLYSVGLHPWHILDVNRNDCFERIIEATRDKNMLFVGECGLDRLINTAFATQEECFEMQVTIAEKYCKPLIIHCVRAYNDLIKVKKERKSLIPWVLHGYNGNLETTRDLLRHGFYFSVGERFLNDKRKHDCLKNIPLNRLFFETDESPDSIETVYQKASGILDIDENDLISIILNNFNTIF